MKLDLDFEIPRDAVTGITERARLRAMSALSEQSERVLKRKRNSKWPRDTSFSSRRFVVETERNGALVRNSAPYAIYVNDRSHYPLGAPNPNYEAAQRTIEHNWTEIVEKATDAAGGEL